MGITLSVSLPSVVAQYQNNKTIEIKDDTYYQLGTANQLPTWVVEEYKRDQYRKQIKDDNVKCNDTSLTKYRNEYFKSF